MKHKIISFTILALFLVAFVSAISINLDSTPGVLTSSDTTTSFTVSTNGDATFDFPSTAIIKDGSNEVELSISASTTSDTATFDVEATSISDDFDFGKYSKTITINATNSSEPTDIDSVDVTITYEKEFYEGENKGELKLDIEELDVSEGFGEDEDWYLFDEIEIELEIANDGNWDIEDIKIEACLYSNDEEECVLDEDDMNLDEEYNIDEGDEETLTTTFTLNPDDFEEGNTDYTLYIRAVGKIDDSDSSYDGDETGVSISKDITLIFDDNFVVIGNIEMPEEVSCDNTFEVRAEVWNIGDEDEEDVLVFVRNDELGISEEIEIGDLDILEDESISFEVTIPETAEEKIYSIKFYVLDEDNDVFENDDDEEAEFEKLLTVSGNCKLPSDVDISASLESEAIAGKEMTIKVTLTNPGTEQTTYQLSIDNLDWAEVKSINPNFVTIPSGGSAEAEITLIPNSDVEGEREFTLDVSFDENVSEQKISVNVQPSQSLFNFDFDLGENWVIWAIGAINVILIVAIIIVAIRIIRR